MTLNREQIEELLLVLTLALLSATSEQLKTDIRKWIQLLSQCIK